MQTVEEEIARQVSDKLRVRLSGEEEERLAKRYTENPAAYNLYLQGRHLLDDVAPEAFPFGGMSVTQKVLDFPNE